MEAFLKFLVSSFAFLFEEVLSVVPLVNVSCLFHMQLIILSRKALSKLGENGVEY